jgi:Bacterial self-protective colicin-like immunity
MSDALPNAATWAALLDQLAGDTISAADFHDRFFSLWHALSGADWAVAPPPAIETLFYVVEAFTPDPALRDGSVWEASEGDMREAARTALVALRSGEAAR